jgi:hypothetical protein
MVHAPSETTGPQCNSAPVRADPAPSRLGSRGQRPIFLKRCSTCTGQEVTARSDIYALVEPRQVQSEPFFPFRKRISRSCLSWKTGITNPVTSITERRIYSRGSGLFQRPFAFGGRTKASRKNRLVKCFECARPLPYGVPSGPGSVKTRMPSPAQRAPREQAVGSECTGYSSAPPKRFAAHQK